MPLFNSAQTRAILCGFLDIHRRMAELEALLGPSLKPTPFSGYVNDLSPTEAKVVQDYFARVRTAMLEHLRESEIPLDIRPTSLRWAIDIGTSFIGWRNISGSRFAASSGSTLLCTRLAPWEKTSRSSLDGLSRS